MANIRGTTGPNIITGTSSSDRIEALAGHDSVEGRAGHDDLFGGDGNDWLWGNSGDDEIEGGAGHDVLFGGPEIATRFIEQGLIDHYRLFVHPVALGDGLPLFPNRTNVKLVSARTFDSAVVALHYERAV